MQQPHLDDVIREDDIEIVLNNAVQNQASSLVYNASGPNGKPTFTFQPEFLTNKIELTDISVSTNAANSGGALSYDNSTGVLSFTPADVSGGGGGGGLSNWTETNGHLLPNADATYDIGRIEDVHFNPWYSDGHPFYWWQTTRGRAFIFGRSDWEYLLRQNQHLSCS